MVQKARLPAVSLPGKHEGNHERWNIPKNYDRRIQTNAEQVMLEDDGDKNILGHVCLVARSLSPKSRGEDHEIAPAD